MINHAGRAACQAGLHIAAASLDSAAAPRLTHLGSRCIPQPQEIHAWARLGSHPNIVRYYSSWFELSSHGGEHAFIQLEKCTCACASSSARRCSNVKSLRRRPELATTALVTADSSLCDLLQVRHEAIGACQPERARQRG